MATVLFPKVEVEPTGFGETKEEGIETPESTEEVRDIVPVFERAALLSFRDGKVPLLFDFSLFSFSGRGTTVSEVEVFDKVKEAGKSSMVR